MLPSPASITAILDNEFRPRSPSRTSRSITFSHDPDNETREHRLQSRLLPLLVHATDTPITPSITNDSPATPRIPLSYPHAQLDPVIKLAPDLAVDTEASLLHDERVVPVKEPLRFLANFATCETDGRLGGLDRVRD